MKSKPPRTLLLTFDAFDTLFHPRTPVPEQYASVAHDYGIPRTALTPQAIQSAFKSSYKTIIKQYPNYGRKDVLRGAYGGPRQWWTDVIRATIAGALSDPQNPEQSTTHNPDTKKPGTELELPDGLLETLLQRFAGAEGYALFDDVEPFFMRLREVKKAVEELTPYERVIVGVVSNSDDRVPAVLNALGLRVGGLRADQDRSSIELPGFEERGKTEIKDSSDEGSGVASVLGAVFGSKEKQGLDIDMVITSYEAGEEKPNRLIFDVARRQAGLLLPKDVSMDSLWCVHVGDDYEKDYVAARDAGWQSCYLDRSGGDERPGLKIRSMEEILAKLRLGHEDTPNSGDFFGDWTAAETAGTIVGHH